ncbi:MAG: ZIP family metal transporter [Bacteroidia bacterium]
MPVINYFLLFITIVISGSSVFAFKEINRKYLKLLLSFSGSYLFALTVLHLLPEVYHSNDNYIGIFIFAGFFIQIILEFFSEGIEHGHIHIHKNQNAAFPYGVMLGLCLHSYLEGMPLVQKFDEPGTQNSLLAGIILHHIPVAIALMSMLLQSGITKKSAVFYLVLFALMAPGGALTGTFISHGALDNLSIFYNRMMAVVIGIFLHISTTILFESYSEHRFNYLKLLIILLGAGLAMLS